MIYRTEYNFSYKQRRVRGAFSCGRGVSVNTWDELTGKETEMGDKSHLFKDTKDLFAKTMRERKMERVKFKWKRSLIMIACAILLYGIMKLILTLDLDYSFVVWFVYEGIAAVAVVSYVITVRGDLSSKPPTEDMLPKEWSDKQKYDYIKLCLKRRDAGKKFLYVAIPFIFAVMAGIVSEIWWPMVTGGM